MNTELSRFAIIGVAIGYLVAMTWAMSNIAYDIWGALIVIPPMTVLTVLGVRRLFGEQFPALVIPMLWGFVLKLGGSAARYWIAFDVYGGASDSGRYHDYGRAMAGTVWSGENNLGSVLPAGTGTQFVERFTSFAYTLFGSSKLGGFLLFGWLAFWGVAWFVKAACVGVPGLARRRYAWLCVIAPSLVYWPSSIGKEALMLCFLGIATYGIALLLVRAAFLRPLIYTAIGITGSALVRPHIAGVWLAAVVPALLVALGRTLGRDQRRTGRGTEVLMLLSVVALAGVAMAIVGSFALRYLKPTDDETSVSQGITAILEETTRRSDTGGSNFPPLVVSGPKDWPYAVVRTLTRPMLYEAHGVLQLLSAAEMTALIGLCLLSWRRLAALPRSIATIPFAAFAVTALFVAGLAYTSFANLGILTRQKSLVFPFLLLIPCLPLPKRRAEEAPVEAERELALVR